MKQYYPDPELKRKLQRTQYKKHPKWHKRKWVRRILLLLAPIGGIAFFCYFNIGRTVRVNEDNSIYKHGDFC
ncbi:hypothetical protein [Clostridium sp. KNHs214]|uniref:hypothetical protein n=1 Tax=Clostridium sp. KNHs214 TaxID=1540257 RepID=UPI000556E1D7|nr:hypothetical protein [Clostridium sp. KNHs214]